MSETPKPPEGYTTWLDWVLRGGNFEWSAIPYAAAELAALRNELAAYKKAVDEHNARMASIPGHPNQRPETPEQALLWLAEWFDAYFQDAGTSNDQVQQDCRQFAAEVAALRAERDASRS